MKVDLGERRLTYLREGKIDIGEGRWTWEKEDKHRRWTIAFR
jgi:hypothetical protein